MPASTQKRLAEHIQREHERWLKIMMPDSEDPYISKTTIGIREVLNAHFLLAEFFAGVGEGLGGIGPKDVNLLHSALSRQFVSFDSIPRWSDRFQVCATLMYGLIKNHPFHDANKRTAFLIALLHLQKLGRTPIAPGQEYEDFTVDIADGALNKYSFWERFTGPSPDREINAIAHFLKRKTREIDLRQKLITYNALNTILQRHGLRIENPYKNRIDIVRFLSKDTLTPLENPYRVAHIGFHGWTRQVSARDIHIARGAAELDIQHGYDSVAFFTGVESPLKLIKKYEEPLRRLAYR